MWKVYDVYCEVIECDNGDQAQWLVERLAEEGVPGQISGDETAVTVRSLFFPEGDATENFEDVVEAVAAFQEHFQMQTPWVGSRYVARIDPAYGRSNCDVVIVHRGTQTWTNATEMAHAKAKKLT